MYRYVSRCHRVISTITAAIVCLGVCNLILLEVAISMILHRISSTSYKSSLASLSKRMVIVLTVHIYIKQKIQSVHAFYLKTDCQAVVRGAS